MYSSIVYSSCHCARIGIDFPFLFFISATLSLPVCSLLGGRTDKANGFWSLWNHLNKSVSVSFQTCWFMWELHSPNGIPFGHDAYMNITTLWKVQIMLVFPTWSSKSVNVPVLFIFLNDFDFGRLHRYAISLAVNCQLLISIACYLSNAIKFI